MFSNFSSEMNKLVYDHKDVTWHHSNNIIFIHKSQNNSKNTSEAKMGRKAGTSKQGVVTNFAGPKAKFIYLFIYIIIII